MATLSTTSLDRHIVTGVLVAHDGVRWLPEALKAVLTQTRPIHRLVAVDTGSQDRGPAVLAEVMGEGNLCRMPRDTGFGEAVAEALDHPAATLAVPGTGTGTGTGVGVGGGSGGGSGVPGSESSGPVAARSVEWVWLLHDDCVPSPNALQMLLTAAESDPRIAILGPKVRDWYDRRALLEMGVTIDGAGRRETGMDRDEFDQGQHDGVRDVLAVGSAGMLVRRDVWRELGGFDSGFGLFREDLDLGWRARAAGHRVVTVSDAVLFHAEASARGRREIAIASGNGRRLDRRNALYVLLGNLPLRRMIQTLLRNIIGTLLRALYLVAAKRPDVARDELAALGDVLRHPLRLRRIRTARARNRKRAYRGIRRHLARHVLARRVFDRCATVLSREYRERDMDLDDDAVRSAGRGPLRRILGDPRALLVLTLAAVALAAERSVLMEVRDLGGGALVPAAGGAADLWREYVSAWHPVGLGSDAQSPPYVAVLALLSTLAFGKPWLVVAVLLLGSVPLAGLTAYVASRALIEPPPKGRRAAVSLIRRRVPVPAVRVWTAATYALLPVATGAIAGGRLATAVVIVLLPLLGLQAARMFGLRRGLGSPGGSRWAARPGDRSAGRPGDRPRDRSGDRPRRRAREVASSVALLWDTAQESPQRRSRRAAWTFALLLTVAMAFVPLTWLLALVMGVLVWVAFGGTGPLGRRGGAGRPASVNGDLVIALGVPPLLLLPWTAGLLAHPSRFLLEAGLHRPELVDARLSGRALLTLDPGGPGSPRDWALCGLLLIAVLALPLRSRRPVVLAGWMLALFGLVAAVLVSATVVTKGAGRAPAWPGVALTFAAAGVLLAAIAAVQRAVDALAGKHTVYRLGGALVLVAALTAPILSAVTWVGTGLDGPLGDGRSEVVPGYLAGGADEAGSPRVLVLNQDAGGRITYSVLRGAAPRIGEADLPGSPAARRRMDLLVGRLVTGRSADAQALTRMGLRFVLVPRAGRARLAPTLDGAPELARFSKTGAYSLWKLVTPGSRLMLLDGQTATPLPAREIGARARIPAGAAGRTLLLTEEAGDGWRATLGGRSLAPVTVDGWAQGFRVPASGGVVEITRGSALWNGWLLLQAAGVLLAAVFALPSGRVDGVQAPTRARRRSSARWAASRVSALARRRPAGVPAGAGTAPEQDTGPGHGPEGGDTPLDETPGSGGSGVGGSGGAGGGAAGGGFGGGGGDDDGRDAGDGAQSPEGSAVDGPPRSRMGSFRATLSRAELRTALTRAGALGAATGDTGIASAGVPETADPPDPPDPVVPAQWRRLPAPLSAPSGSSPSPGSGGSVAPVSSAAQASTVASDPPASRTGGHRRSVGRSSPGGSGGSGGSGGTSPREQQEVKQDRKRGDKREERRRGRRRRRWGGDPAAEPDDGQAPSGGPR